MRIFSRSSKAVNSAIGGWIILNLELIRDFILVICKNEEDQTKMKALEWSHDFHHHNPTGAIFVAKKNLILNLPSPIDAPDEIIF